MASKYCPYPIIAGPTASGKTAVAVALAKRLSAEVVSADSMQVYAEVSVGTARPTIEEMQGIPHYLVGFLPLSEKYSVARYVEDAKKVFAEIYARNSLPLLCGGTGLYIQSFMENIQFFSNEPNMELRDRLKEKARLIGGEGMLDELRKVDSESAARLHENDLNRIVRALEIYYTTGHTIREQDRLSKTVPSPYTPCLFLLNYRDRKILYQRIDERVDAMLKSGLLEEVKRIRNVSPDATFLQAIGYKELMPYLRGEMSLDACVRILKTNTHHYAKRQLSWFNRMEGAQTVWMDGYTSLDEAVDFIAERYAACCKEAKNNA